MQINPRMFSVFEMILKNISLIKVLLLFVFFRIYDKIINLRIAKIDEEQLLQNLA